MVRHLALLCTLPLLAACVGPEKVEHGARASAAALARVEATTDLTDAGSVAALGQAQLADGRFVAAADTLASARALGDDAPRTLLSAALALAGSWRHEEAAELLFAHMDGLPAADCGLALALAEEPQAAIAVLVQAVEQRPDDAALRQNLALAYALAGRWREARGMAALDVPPDRLPARLEHWARLASMGPTPQRMAAVLGIAELEAPRPRPRRIAAARPRWAGARW